MLEFLSIFFATLCVALVVLFYREIRALLQWLTWRIKMGAPFKIAAFEISSPYVPPLQPYTVRKIKGIPVRRDDDKEFHNTREPFRTTFRNLFLVHRLAPSRYETQLYDVLIYLVPSLRHGSLEGVNLVEYYFGRYWDYQIFTSIDRANGFSIRTSAWAPFSCTAKVHFTDRQAVFLHRFIDFEMGALGNFPLTKDDKKGTLIPGVPEEKKTASEAAGESAPASSSAPDCGPPSCSPGS